MAESLAPAAPYTTSFTATVTGVSGTDVTLSETYFYPAGGGQPADRGTVGGVQVEHVHEADGEVVHVLEAEPDFGEGEAVQGEVDPEFRRYCRRAHTASHVLYGAGRRVLEDLGYGGFDISEEKVRVDFETSTDIDDDVLAELERLTNRAVWDSHDVTWEQVPADEARSRDDVAFNTKTEEGVMADADSVRVVTVADWDVAACGGTHVENTSEIGPVSVLSRSNPGEGLTRVEFAVGPSAIERQAAVRRASLDAAATLGVPEDELGDAAARLQSENERLEAELADLKSEVLDSRVAGLDSLSRDGETWLVGTLDGFDANEVGDAAKEAVGDDADVVAVAGGEGNTFVVVAADGADADAGDVVGDVTDAFGGGGGGRPSFAQGGGLDADADDVADYLREE
ncbi:alanine--tRNA ligase-related protein [Halobacterium litoreum]|uniref:DHHA1 domain-containing protein n=1 Tax=Halobacterium litoreum TaxID=2039234 RepID=A0ABD5NCP6_9EURY|nr:DHHA1 domain-containing protein [Halobacterium litoreum]UHH14170.1 DHHA1 domain-containing protein [Halobacterium litoreum]